MRNKLITKSRISWPQSLRTNDPQQKQSKTRGKFKVTTGTKATTLPNSKESEMMILGCMLSNAHALNISCKVLSEHDFYFSEHKYIFQSIKATWRIEGVADVHLTCEQLKTHDKLELIGGIGYVANLVQYAGTSAYIEQYIEILKEKANQRKIFELAIDLQKKAIEDENFQKTILFAQESLKLIERNKGAKEKFPIKFLNEFDENFLIVEPPEKAMLLEYAKEDGSKAGFLPKGIVAMLVGSGGVGKTHLLAQLAISIATDTPFLDVFTTTKHCGLNKQGNVFLGLGENHYDDIHRLLFKATKHLRKNKSIDLKNDQTLFSASSRIAPFSFCGQQASFIEDKKPSLYFRELKMRLQDIAPQHGWNLIILDPVSRIMGADAETDNAAATQFISLLEELSMDLPGNPTILFAHHTNKSAFQTGTNQNQTAARGLSALTDGVRWQCNYTKDTNEKNITILKMTKSNFTAILEDIKTEKSLDGFIRKYYDPHQKEKSQNLFGTFGKHEN